MLRVDSVEEIRIFLDVRGEPKNLNIIINIIMPRVLSKILLLIR